MNKTYGPGVRFSMTDGIALFLAVIAAAASAFYSWELAAGIAFVVGHFFLFCNVFRIARNLELIWASVFVALAASTVLAESPGWLLTFVMTFSVTVIVVVLEMRKPTYHGFLWRRINPELPDWPPQDSANA